MTRASITKPFLKSFWQRIFSVIIVFVLVSQFVFFVELFLEKTTQEDKRSMVLEYMSHFVDGLQGKSISALEVSFHYFNGAGPQMWLENASGEVAGGMPVSGFLFEDRPRLPVLKAPESTRNRLERSKMAYPVGPFKVWRARVDWETGPNAFVEVLGCAVNLAEGPYTLFYAFENGPIPLVNRYFPYGLMLLCVFSVALSYLLSRWLASPLALLRKEVLSINEATLLRPLTVQGPQEVADVARSVNHLTGILAKHADGMKELVANVSHELRSPILLMEFACSFVGEGLAAMAENVDSARLAGFTVSPAHANGGPEGPAYNFEEQRALAFKYFGFLQEELKHLEKIVGNNILSSKLGLQHELVDKAPFDMAYLCRTVLEQYGPLAHRKEKDITASLPDVLRFTGDALLMKQLLLNLLDNALQYSSEKARVHLRLYLHEPASGAERPELRLLVKNPCAKLDDEKLARIFEPFYRAGIKSGGGTGLGLHCAEKIAKLHSGSMRAEQDDEGLGILVIIPIVNDVRQI